LATGPVVESGDQLLVFAQLGLALPIQLSLPAHADKGMPTAATSQHKLLG